MAGRPTAARLFRLCIILLAWKLVILVIPAWFNVHEQIDGKEKHVLDILWVILVSMHPLSVLDKHLNDLDRFFLTQYFYGFVVG